MKQDAKQVIEGQPTWDKWGKVNDASVTFPMEKLRNFMKLFGKKDRDGASVLVTTNGDTVTLNGHAAGLNVSASFTGTVGKNAPKAIVVPLFCEFWKANDISKVALTYSETELWVWCWMPTKGGGDRQSVTYTLKAYQGVAELEKKLGIANDMCTEKDTAKAAERDRLAEENAKLKKQVASLMGTESGKVRKLNAEVKRLNEELRKVSDKQNADHAETVLELERSIKELKNQLAIEKANHKTTKQEVKELNETIGKYQGKYADAVVERKAALDKVAKLESELDAKASEKEEKGMAEVVQFNAPVNKTDLAIGVNDDGSGIQLDNESGNLTGRILIGWSVQGEKYWPITFNGKHIEKAKCLFIYGAQSNEKDEVQKSLRGIEGFEDAEIEWAPNKKCFFFDNPFCTAEQVA